MQRVFLVLCIMFFFVLNIQAASPQQVKKVAPPKINKTISKMNPSQLKFKRYVQLDQNGDKVVKDNSIGLMWEVKSAKDGSYDYDNPNDADNQYTWYDPNPNTNGGHQGLARNGTDSSDFINALNSRQYAGYNNWRMPTIDELKTLVAESDNYQKINTNLFPNTIFVVNNRPHYYWTSSTYGYSDPPGKCAWNIAFNTGRPAGNHGKSKKYHIRAVRSIR
jgi:hypothetical protein